MPNNPNNIYLGASRVRWGGRSLGLTMGGVDVSIKTETHPVSVDQYGKTNVQEFVMGRTLSVKCPFAETDLDTLYALTRTSGGSIVDNGVAATGAFEFTNNPVANDQIAVGPGAGHPFTFVTAVTGPDQILIGTNIAQTITNALRVLTASTDANLTQLIFSSGVVTTHPSILVTAYKSGTSFNTWVMGTTGTNVGPEAGFLTGGTNATDRYVTGTSGAGIGLYSTAQPLVLHPVSLADNDFSQDFVVPLANTSGSVDFSYKVDNERIFSVEFTGYVNTSSGNLFYYGDTTPLGIY